MPRIKGIDKLEIILYVFRYLELHIMSDLSDIQTCITQQQSIKPRQNPYLCSILEAVPPWYRQTPLFVQYCAQYEK